LRVRRALGCCRVIHARLGSGLRPQQVSAAGELDPRIGQLRLGGRDRCLLARDLRLEGRALHAEQRLARPHLLPLAEQPLLEESCHAGAQIHAVGCLDAADEVHLLRHRLRGGDDHPDRRRPRWSRLRQRRRGEQEGKKNEARAHAMILGGAARCRGSSPRVKRADGLRTLRCQEDDAA
jgi:hypothetical protein